MPKKYRAAIIGLGNIGYGFQRFNTPFLTTHFEAYKKSSEVELVAVCDINEELVQTISTKYDLHGYTNSAELLKKENLDIVSICTPDNTHSSLVEDAVAVGVKGIWCEKPLAESLLTAQEMVSLCKEKNIVLAVNFFRRYDQFYQEVKNRLLELVGDIQTVTAYYSGGLVTVGSHVTDLLNFFFGPAEAVTAEKTASGILGQVHYGSGFVVNLVPMQNPEYTIMEFNIFGKKACLNTINKPFGEYEYRYFPLEASNFAPTSFIGNKQENPLSRMLPRTYMEAGLKDLLECVENSNQPVSSGTTALQSLELISAIVHAGDHVGEKIFLPLSLDLLINLPPAGGDVHLWEKP